MKMYIKLLHCHYRCDKTYAAGRDSYHQTNGGMLLTTLCV